MHAHIGFYDQTMQETRVDERLHIHTLTWLGSVPPVRYSNPNTQAVKICEGGIFVAFTLELGFRRPHLVSFYG